MADRVADTSLLAALFFNEPRAAEAEAMISNARLHEPTLLASELASVCRKKILHHRQLREPLLSSLEIGLSLDIKWVTVDQVAIVELALETELTTYDATFLWLSRALGVPLLTFDEQLLRFAET